MPVPAAAGKVAAGKVAAVERVNAVRQGIERRLRRHVNGLEGAGAVAIHALARSGSAPHRTVRPTAPHATTAVPARRIARPSHGAQQRRVRHRRVRVAGLTDKTGRFEGGRGGHEQPDAARMRLFHRRASRKEHGADAARLRLSDVPGHEAETGRNPDPLKPSAYCVGGWRDVWCRSPHLPSRI